jgi:uncharacterized protein with HEPN domain
MAGSSPVARLTDIIEAAELISSEMAGVTLPVFANDRRKRWLVERGIEIISEASRHLPDAMKARQPGIPWPKVSRIGNVLHHEYEPHVLPTMCCGTWCRTICRCWNRFAATS